MFYKEAFQAILIQLKFERHFPRKMIAYIKVRVFHQTAEVKPNLC